MASIAESADHYYDHITKSYSVAMKKSSVPKLLSTDVQTIKKHCSNAMLTVVNVFLM
ncbi:MAG: hypothetical protein IJM38_09480 [Ruminococcus sp.]|nr:hypothetical protein [Ruminococcus sp.]